MTNKQLLDWLILKRFRQCLLLLAVLFGLLVGSPAWSGEVQARLNRDTALEGDVVVLTIRAENLPGNNQPDLSPLDADFDVLGTSNSSQVQIINGQRTDSRSWQVSLMPKRLGSIEIPSLSVAGEQTQPLSLTVKEVPMTVDGNNQKDIFVEMELDGDDSPYVQQGVGLTVRIYTAQQIREGDLSRPQSDHAVIEQLGEDKTYMTKRNSRDYQVVERQYAVFTQQSGELRIAPVIFRGSVEAPQQNQQRRPRSGTMNDIFNDPFFNGPGMSRLFNRGKPVTIRSNAIKLNVRSAPGSVAAGEWLPAEDLQLTDSWLGQSMQPTAGEPLTRTLTVTAKGLSGSQIPDLELPETTAMRIYPDPVQHETRTDGKKVTGTSTQTFTLVPQQAGKLTVPEIAVTWWDTENDEARTATVAAVTLDVVKGIVKVPAPEEKAAKVVDNNKTEINADSSSTDLKDDTDAVEDQPSIWPWLLLLATVVATFLVLLFRKRSQPQQIISQETPDMTSFEHRLEPEPEPVDIATLKADCLQACRSDNARLATTTLLEWVKAEWQDAPPGSLSMLADQMNAGAETVRALDRSVYSGSEEAWDGGPLAALLEKGLIRKTAVVEKKDKKTSLDPLYPTN